MWVLTCVSAGLYLIVQSPVAMVKAGGVAQALMLPVIAGGALYLRYKRLPHDVVPGKLVTTALWVASITTIGLMAHYALLLISKN